MFFIRIRGFEIGFGAISVFMYDFKDAIEYVPGFNTDVTVSTIELDADATLYVDSENPDNNGPGIGCVLNSSWTENDATTFELDGCIYKTVSTVTSTWNKPIYQNTGSYTTQGFRFANSFGPVSLLLKFTDTDQVRVPEFAGVISVQEDFKGFVFKLDYAVQLNREPGLYDVLPEGEEFLEDLEKLDFQVTKKFTSGVTLAFKIENITDEVVEITPYYDSRGREVYLTLNYNW